MTSADLRERELIKLASLSSALAGSLRQRGISEIDASLAAETSIAVFRVAFSRWITAADEQDLGVAIRETLTRLQALTGDD